MNDIPNQTDETLSSTERILKSFARKNRRLRRLVCSLKRDHSKMIRMLNRVMSRQKKEIKELKRRIEQLEYCEVKMS